MTDSLDDILARKQPEAAPAQEEPKQETETQQQEAPKPEASAEPAPQETVAEGDKGQKMVPHEALHAEKQKVKRYTEEVAEFRKSNEALQKQINELLQRVPVPQQQQQQPADWYVDPPAAFEQSIAPVLTPIQRQMQALESQITRMQAERVFGDKFGEFLSYVKENANDPEVVALNAAMDRVPDPFTYAKQWYDKKTFDPDAERERIKAQLLEEMKSQQSQTPPAVLPSNLAGARNVGARSGPQWSGPPSLQDIFKR